MEQEISAVQDSLDTKVIKLLEEIKIKEPSREQLDFLKDALGSLDGEPKSIEDLVNGKILSFCKEKKLLALKDDPGSTSISSALKTDGQNIIEVHGFVQLIDPQQTLTFNKDHNLYGENVLLRKFVTIAKELRRNFVGNRFVDKVLSDYLPPISNAGNPPEKIIIPENRHVFLTNDYSKNRMNMALISKRCVLHRIPFTKKELECIVRKTAAQNVDIQPIPAGEKTSLPIDLEIQRKVDCSRVEKFIKEKGIDLMKITRESILASGISTATGEVFEKIALQEVQSSDFINRIKKVLGEKVQSESATVSESSAINSALRIFANNTLMANPDTVLIEKTKDGFHFLAPVEVKSGQNKTIHNDQLAKLNETLMSFARKVSEKINMSGGKGASVNGLIIKQPLRFRKNPIVIMVRPLETPTDSTEPKRNVKNGSIPVYVFESSFTLEEVQSYVYKVFKNEN